MKFRALLFALLLISPFAGAQQWITGKVLDVKGAGIEGVVVSDGYTVVKSDATGSYFFDTNPKAKFIFVSTPYGHDHKGSFYQRIGEGAEYNFTLVKVEKTPNTFIHLSDTEASVYKDWVTLFKSYVSDVKPAFVVFNGDICYEKGMRFHAKELMSENLGVRTVYTLGNHDLVDGASGEELYEKLFGPVWYSFNSGGVHFVNLPVLYGDRKTSYTADDVYSWLKKDLEAVAPGTPVVIFDHHLVGFETNFVLKTDKMELDLMAYNLKAYLYGHYHTNLYHKTLKGGVATISTMSPNKGGIDHSPSSFRLITFSPAGDLKSQLVYSPLDKHIRATAFRESTQQGRTLFGGERTGIKVIASLYDTPSNVTAAWAVAGKKEYKLTKTGTFTWITTIPGSAFKKGEELSLSVKANFSDGSQIIKPADIAFANATGAGSMVPQIMWSSNLGAPVFMTSPVVSESLVICATTDDDSSKVAAITALDKKSGKTVWSFRTVNSVKNSMAVWDGVLFAADVEGRVYALDMQRGTLKWSRELRSNSIHPVYTQGVTVHDGVLYAGQGAFLTALRVSDGKVLWVNEAWKGGVSTVATPVVEKGSGVLLTAAYWTGRFAHDASTGKLLWEKRDDDTRIADNSPVAFGGSLFYSSPNYITEVNPVTGEELLKHRIPYTINSNSRPLVTENYYITGTADKGVAAFDRKREYREMWNFKTNPSILYTAPYTKDFQMTVEGGVVMQGDNVYFGANDGYIYCVEARTGVFRWRLNVGMPVLGTPVIDNGILYAADFAGNMWAVKI